MSRKVTNEENGRTWNMARNMGKCAKCETHTVGLENGEKQ
jgi:hypothetical protein